MRSVANSMILGVAAAVNIGICVGDATNSFGIGMSAVAAAVCTFSFFTSCAGKIINAIRDENE